MTTREEIIAAAKECFDCYEDGRGRLEYSADEYGLERFYAIAFEAGCQAEREECAEILEKTDLSAIPDNNWKLWTANTLLCYAAIFRARGDTK